MVLVAIHPLGAVYRKLKSPVESGIKLLFGPNFEPDQVPPEGVAPFRVITGPPKQAF